MNMSTYFLFTFYLNFIFYLMFLAQIEEVSDMPLLNVIEKLGGWPVTDPNWDETKAIDLETLVAVIKRNFTLGVLIEEWVGPDDRNSEKHIIQVSFVYLKGNLMLLNEMLIGFDIDIVLSYNCFSDKFYAYCITNMYVTSMSQF